MRRRRPNSQSGALLAGVPARFVVCLLPHRLESLPMIQARRPTIVVVGTGMAGARVVEEILARTPDRFHLRMFGAEPHGTYNRILLSTVLGGFADPKQLWLNPLEWYESRDVYLHAGVRVEQIDPAGKLVSGA